VRKIEIDETVLEYEVRGDGEPVLLIHPSVFADALAHPLYREPELSDGYALIHYHRRAWVGSGRGDGPLDVMRHAADARALLERLDVDRAHVVGHSYGGLIALQLAGDAPERVNTLILLEPALRPPAGGRSQLEKVMAGAMQELRAGNRSGFLAIFGDALFGEGWRPILDAAVPGAFEQAVRDVDTFIEEQPSLMAWELGPQLVGAITQPVLSVIGTRSPPFRSQQRELLHSLLPQTEDCDLDTGHLLQIQDPAGAARALAGFFKRTARVGDR